VNFITQLVDLVDVTGHLAPSSRIVPSPPALVTVLRQLILGPTEIEKAAGYSSALPVNLVVISATVKNSIGYIDLATPLSVLPRSQQILAVGQIVGTASDVGALNGIEITVGGAAQATLLPSGRRSLLVTVKDYQQLLNG
jgi:spore germination protein GerM